MKQESNGESRVECQVRSTSVKSATVAGLAGVTLGGRKTGVMLADRVEARIPRALAVGVSN